MSGIQRVGITAGTRERLRQLASEYELICEIGRGAAAVVYLVRDRALGRDVALKVVHQTHVDDADAVARLAREARLIAQLRHPGIVTLYGTRQLDDGSIALLMQYVPGRSLKAAIREQGPFPVDTTIRILTDIAAALDYAHRKYVIHRDIKPENICIDDDGGRALLSDFGIARSSEVDSSLTMIGGALGTPAYMSPEQIDGRELDARSDLYSLGLVAYEMLTGRQPWAGENLYTTIYKQKHEDLPPVETQRGDVTPELRRALAGLLHKDRDARWRNAAEFIAQLAPANAPVSEPAEPHHDEPVRHQPALPAVVVQEDTPTVLYLAASMQSAERDPETAPVLSAIVPAQPEPPAAQGDDVSAQRHLKAARDSDAFAAAGTAPELRFFLEPDVPGRTVVESRPTISAVKRKRDWRRAAVLVPLFLFAVGGAAAPILVGEGDLRATIGRAFPASADAGAPGSRLIALTQGQSGYVGGSLPLPVGILVRDDSGRAVAGVAVQFDVVAGGGQVESNTVSTDPHGLAVVQWTLGPRPGVNQLQARLRGRTDVLTLIHATASVGPAVRLTRMSRDDGEWAGRDSMTLVLRAEDEFGNPVPGANVEFAVRSGDGSVRPRRAVSDSSGAVLAMWKRGTTGVDSLRATLPNAQQFIDIGARGPFRLTITPAVAAGGGHTCVLDARGSVACRGTAGSAPTAARFARLAAGTSHTCGLDVDGRALCWGSNNTQQLGVADPRSATARVESANRRPFVAVAAGHTHTCALTDEATWCWGNNLPPERVPGSRFSAIAVGWRHTCGISATRAVHCWGANADGQLGDGTYSYRPTPVPIVGNLRFSAISAGAMHTCGITPDGNAYCWGENSSGQLGTGTFTGAERPQRVQLSIPLTTVVAGAFHSCALTRSGEAYCWGRNDAGQLGSGTAPSSTVPLPIAGDQRFTQLSASGSRTCGRTVARGSFCWGSNADQQIGG